jgi:hypothetical protein
MNISASAAKEAAKMKSERKSSVVMAPRREQEFNSRRAAGNRRTWALRTLGKMPENLHLFAAEGESQSETAEQGSAFVRRLRQKITCFVEYISTYPVQILRATVLYRRCSNITAVGILLAWRHAPKVMEYTDNADVCRLCNAVLEEEDPARMKALLDELLQVLDERQLLACLL